MDEPFILNVADAPVFSHPRRASIIDFEPDEAHMTRLYAETLAPYLARALDRLG